MCKDCKLFDAYKKEERKEPNNCTTWLCNDGKCPLDKINSTTKKFNII